MAIKYFLLLFIWTGLSVLAADTRTEVYHYKTFRSGDADTNVIEHVRMEFGLSSNKTVVTYQSRRADGLEIVRVATDGSGLLDYGEAVEYDGRGRQRMNARLWREDDTVYVRRMTGFRGVRERSRNVPEGAVPVGDAGLMAWLRFYPFASGYEQQLFIATFSQHFVRMTMRKTGDEVITVPAGTYDCYVLEGVVNLFVTEIVTIYWITREPPHYLVKYRGRRGVFLAPVYESVLVE